MNEIYLEIKDRRGGLLVEVKNEIQTTCTFEPANAMKFKSEHEAVHFIKENNLTGQFKPIVLISINTAPGGTGQ